MIERYIAFDVETPNSANHRMSSIGICVVENGKVVREFATLVDPQTYFAPFNISLTGITPSMVDGAPTFPELWRIIEPIMNSGVLVAHNAPFDMGVLGKCLRDYGISWKTTARYACTCQMARASFCELPNHRLNTVSEYLGIELDHHQAASDARACAEIFCHCLERGLNPVPFQRTFDFGSLRTVPCR